MELSDAGRRLLDERSRDGVAAVVRGDRPLPPVEYVYLVARYGIENREGMRERCAEALRAVPAAVVQDAVGRLAEPELLFFLSFVFQDNAEILGALFSRPDAAERMLEKFTHSPHPDIARLAAEALKRRSGSPEMPLAQSAAEPAEEQGRGEEERPAWAAPAGGRPADAASSRELVEDVSENDEESKRSISGKISKMGVAEKIKLASLGNKEVRGILIKDSNKLVSGAVMKNPRITEGEVIKISQDKNMSDEIIRLIANDRNWTQNYAIKLNLVLHPKTPVQASVKFLPALGNKDLAGVAKSKNVASVIATSARKILVTRTR